MTWRSAQLPHFLLPSSVPRKQASRSSSCSRDGNPCPLRGWGVPTCVMWGPPRTICPLCGQSPVHSGMHACLSHTLGPIPMLSRPRDQSTPALGSGSPRVGSGVPLPRPQFLPFCSEHVLTFWHYQMLQAHPAHHQLFL